MRFTTHLEGFALRASARSKDRAIDTSSPQSTGDRHSMCAIRATATLTTTTKRRERERERKYRLLRCNTNNRKSSALSALFRVRRALEGVVVFLNIVSRRRRRRPIGFKRVKTPFPHPNYLGSQNRCGLFPEDFPHLFLHKKRAQKKVTSCPFVATYSGTRLPAACLSFPRLRRHRCRSGTPPPPVVFGRRLFAASLCRHDSMTRMKPLVVVGVVTRRQCALNGGCLQNTIEL